MTREVTLRQFMPHACSTASKAAMAWDRPLQGMTPSEQFFTGFKRVHLPLMAVKTGAMEGLALPVRALAGTSVMRQLQEGPTNFWDRGVLGLVGDAVFTGCVGAGVLASAVPAFVGACLGGENWGMALLGVGVALGALVGAVAQTPLELAGSAVNVALHTITFLWALVLTTPPELLIEVGCGLAAMARGAGVARRLEPMQSRERPFNPALA